jgi:hypothetical protein
MRTLLRILLILILIAIIAIMLNLFDSPSTQQEVPEEQTIGAEAEMEISWLAVLPEL